MKMLMITYPKAEQLVAALDDAAEAIKEVVRKDNDQSRQLRAHAEFLTKAMDPQGTPIVVKSGDLLRVAGQ